MSPGPSSSSSQASAIEGPSFSEPILAEVTQIEDAKHWKAVYQDAALYANAWWVQQLSNTNKKDTHPDERDPDDVFMASLHSVYNESVDELSHQLAYLEANTNPSITDPAPPTATVSPFSDSTDALAQSEIEASKAYEAFERELAKNSGAHDDQTAVSEKPKVYAEACLFCINHKGYYAHVYVPFNKFPKDFIAAHREKVAGLLPEQLAAYEQRLDVEIMTNTDQTKVAKTATEIMVLRREISDIDEEFEARTRPEAGSAERAKPVKDGYVQVFPAGVLAYAVWKGRS